MKNRIRGLVLAAFLAPGVIHAQFDFQFDRVRAQIHSFGSFGYANSDVNNYLTMPTSSGSFDLVDAGVNVSMQISDHFRVGAQGYIRDFGRLGQWHPTLDYGYADYRFKDWFGLRGGKVKTVLGLYNEIQDNQFLYTFALLPQAVYPTDLRDATIGHLGGDAYGSIPIKRLGTFSYTGYVGHRQDTRYGGYLLMLQDRGVNMNSYGGLQYGADLKWSTPLKGLLLGGSHMREHITGTGSASCGPTSPPINCQTWNSVSAGNYMEKSRKDETTFGSGEFTAGNLRVAGEYRRYWRDQIAWNGMWDVRVDTRGWYLSAAYRLSKRFELGTYYSRFDVMYIRGTLPPSFDTSNPANHLYDKVITARFDVTKWWSFKIEGHFMDGWGGNQSPDGFYTTDNPRGLQPQTNLLLLRTGFSF